MAFKVIDLEIPEVKMVKSDKFYDDRGYFMEICKITEFQHLQLADAFPQYNLSYSKKDVVRGLHFQKGESAQGKFLYLIAGSIRDVIVDARPESPTYKKVITIDLQGEDNTFIYIPVGFAHGFSVFSNEAYVLYGCTREYNKTAESGIRYDDPQLGIDWGVKNPIVSSKDKELPHLQ